MYMEKKKLNLLSLDGGGIRGLSSLYVLKQIMDAIDPENPPKPCDYFDMIGGTGSGGLIAIMLGRLKMDIQTCINVYHQLLLHSFPPRILPFSRAKFDAPRFEDALEAVLVELGYDPAELFRETNPSCRVVIYLADFTTQRIVPLPTFENRQCPPGLYEAATIAEAGRVCLSSLSGYKPVAIGPDGQKYVDGSMTAANPVRRVWRDAAELWPGLLESGLGCLVSIGAGNSSLVHQGMTKKMGAVRLLGQETGNPETEANAFLRDHTRLDNEGRLFRFNVPDGLGDIEVSEVKAMEVIADVTRDYLAREMAYKQVRKCAMVLAW